MKHTVRITVAIKLPSKNYFIFGRTWWSRTTCLPSSPSQPISPACRPIGAASTCHLGQARPCFTGTPHIKAAQDYSCAAQMLSDFFLVDGNFPFTERSMHDERSHAEVVVNDSANRNAVVILLIYRDLEGDFVHGIFDVLTNV